MKKYIRICLITFGARRDCNAKEKGKCVFNVCFMNYGEISKII